MNSQVEFKDVRVTSGSSVLYSSDFANGASEWRTMGGTWVAEDGVYKQTAPDARTRAGIGGNDWRDDAVTLKVREAGGEGRVSISVRSQGPFGGVTLNLGGPVGTLATMDRMGFGMGRGARNTLGTAPGSFENGRWYDVKIDVTGPRASG